MRLHLLRPTQLSTALVASLVFSGVALFSTAVLAESNTAKLAESAPGQTPARPSKLSARISAQAQLFIEQKEAPTASKTSLRVDSAPRFSAKLKD